MRKNKSIVFFTPTFFKPASLALTRVIERVHHMNSSVLSLRPHTQGTRGKHIHKDEEKTLLHWRDTGIHFIHMSALSLQ